MRHRPLLPSCIVMLLTACGAEPPTSAPAPGPASGGVLRPAALTEVTSHTLPGLAYEAQPGWIPETTSSSFRVAQYVLPAREHGEGAGAGEGRLVLYYFGAGAGSVQANLDRWIGQFTQPDKRSSSEVAKIAKIESNGLPVNTIDLSGTYIAETFPGSNEYLHQPGHRMLAAIVSTRAGPYYAKLIGPAATVTAWESSYDAFVDSFSPADASDAPAGRDHP